MVLTFEVCKLHLIIIIYAQTIIMIQYIDFHHYQDVFIPQVFGNLIHQILIYKC